MLRDTQVLDDINSSLSDSDKELGSDVGELQELKNEIREARSVLTKTRVRVGGVQRN